MHFFNSSALISPEIFEHCLGKENVPIHLLTFWALESSLHVHQSDEATSGLPEVSRYMTGDIPRRHADSLAQTREELLKKRAMVLDLLENLGFLGNRSWNQLSH